MGGLEGRTLDRYLLRQKIGKGGMADVYLGYDPRFERIVAVKVFKRDDDDLLRRFIREAQFMADLRHAHLMPIYDTGECLLDGVTHYFIVMPFMEGGTLRGRIHDAPLSLQETCRYLRQIADALDYIHQRGIIHRDIKSSNVLLDAEDRCYLSDFGIARMDTDVTMTITGGVLGTIDYVAPELFETNQKANTYSDLYSLGVLVFEMVTKQLPFSAENQIALLAMHINNRPPSPRSLVPHISFQTERVMLKALAKRPEQRYASATIFAEMFCRSLSIRPLGSISTATGPIRPADAIAFDEKSAGTLPSMVNVPPVRPMPLARSTEGRSLPETEDPFSQSSGRQSLSASTQGKSHSLTTTIHGMMVTILALFALLIIVAPMVFMSFTHQADITGTPTPSSLSSSTQPIMQVHATPVSTSSATATSASIPNPTTTVRAATATTVQRTAHATATVGAQQTSTVQTQVDATAGVIQTAVAGNASYSDFLNNPYRPATSQANWDQNNNCVFRNDGYHVFARKMLGSGQSNSCVEHGHSYANATISVDMVMLSGHTGGVFFRANAALLMRTCAGYLFEVDSQGNYAISRSSNFITGKIFLKEGTTPAGFHAGYNTKNTLQIIANGSSLSFYINNVFLDQVTDTSFSSGNIAFLSTSADGDPDAEITYRNLRVVPAS